MAIEGDAILPDGTAEPVVREVRTNHQDSDDVLDFKPYQDESDDETDGRKGVPSLIAEVLPAEVLPNPSFGQRYHLLGVAIFVGLFFVLFATELILVGLLPWFPRPKQPNPGQPLPPPLNRNFALNFPEVYPKLDVNRSSSECRAAWETLTNIPCHEGIWRRDWDAGIADPLSPLTDTLVPLICQNKICPARLSLANTLLHSVCIGENAFALEGYLGRFNTTLLEPNAQDVVDVLLERHTRTCRTSPPGDADGGYCMMDVNTRFGIVDGFRSDGLEGLNSFLRQTDLNSSSGGVTTCSWCTIAWFQEKLNMWEEGKIVKDGSALSLPDYLAMWERAGRRCTGKRFDDVYNTTIKSYVDRGLLESGWLPKPSEDIAYLIQNGASTSDYPVPEVIDLYSTLIAYIENTADDGPDIHKRLILVKEYMACLDSIQAKARSIDFYPFLSWANITAHILSDIDTAMIACSEARAIGADELRMEFFWTCPNFRNWENKYEEELATLFLPFSIHPILKRFGTIDLFQSACFSADYRRGGVPCAAIYAQWGMQDWALIRRGENMHEIIRVTRRELLRLPEMPLKLKGFKRPTNRTLTDEERVTEIERNDWVWANANGVCSDCVWRRFVDERLGFSGLYPAINTLELAMEWLKTAHLLRGRCLEVGKEFSESELQVASNSWLYSYGQDRWDEAFREGREGPPWLYE